jgi:hypothetical protein
MEWRSKNRQGRWIEKNTTKIIGREEKGGQKK